MNTKSNDPQKIKEAFDQLFNSFTPEEKIEADARILMFRFLDVVERRCEMLDLNRKQLAEKVGTSASYITQLFRGDRMVNMNTLAKFQKALGLEFEIAEKKSYEETVTMIAIPSEIHLESFAVLQSHYQFIQPKRTIKEPLRIFKTYEIDIDFAHQVNDDKTIHVFTKISVNQNEKPLPGYQLFVEGAAVFSLTETEGMSEAEEKNLKFYSTVNILIGYLRNTLAAITASSPMGPYLLPPINMADLFRKKSGNN